MSVKLHFLGTGCMVPTPERNHLSIAFEYEGQIFLFDCGEGTQTQIRKMKLSPGKIKKIFISHWHGDHVIGLNGLLQTLGNIDSIERLEIHGPKGSRQFVDHTIKSSIFHPTIAIDVIEHDPEEGELKEILSTTSYTLYCAKLNHSVPCIGYRFKETDKRNIDKKKAESHGLSQSPLLSRAKMNLPIELEDKTIYPDDISYVKDGMSVTLIFDTRPCQGVDLLSQDADHLVMEATYMQSHAEKAEEYEHMAARETAEIARTNGVKHLFITHFSQRYKDTKEIEAEAREVFENTTSTYDLMSINLK